MEAFRHPGITASDVRVQAADDARCSGL